MRPPRPAMAPTAARQHKNVDTKLMLSCCISSALSVAPLGAAANPPARIMGAPKFRDAGKQPFYGRLIGQITRDRKFDGGVVAIGETLSLGLRMTRNVANGTQPYERSNDRGAQRARPAGHNDMALMIVHGSTAPIRALQV